MAGQTRKRFSAFEDFPTGEQPTPPEKAGPESVTAVTHPAAANKVERIERLRPSQMMPDRFQPRRLLPGSLRAGFFSGRMDCYKAAAEWLRLARIDPSYQAEIDRLLAMGGSFDEHGQIKPVTGSWVTGPKGSFIFQIETGERRFWAACLQMLVSGAQDEPLLRVEVIENPTRQRQVLENRHAEPPSAVGQACEVASLILAELNLPADPGLHDEYDYFRLARSQRMPAGLWERIMPVMQLTRPRMVQLLNLLQMSTSLLDLANRYRLPERVLREVLTRPPEQWENLVRISIQNNLTSEDLVEMNVILPGKTTPAGPVNPAPRPEPVRVAAGGLRRFALALSKLDEFDQSQALDEIADTLVATGIAEGLMVFLDELSTLVEARLRRK
ncbi:MAG: hypothetical protein AB9891_00640 [Anaerolineaceae bacterium]